MTTHSIGEFKAKFSDILEDVRRGAVVGVRYGRGREPVAFLVPPEKAPAQLRRKLGPLRGRATFRLKRDFKMSDEELLGP